MPLIFYTNRTNEKLTNAQAHDRVLMTRAPLVSSALRQDLTHKGCLQPLFVCAPLFAPSLYHVS